MRGAPQLKFTQPAAHTEDMPPPSESQLLERAESADRESKYLDFKEQCDPSSDRETIELIKDIVAMANSGGRIIVFGVRNDGRPSGSALGPIRRLEAVLTDKIFRYTGEDFAEFELRDVQRRRTQVAALLIRPVSAPMVFVKPGCGSDPTTST
jgi:Putative DNA-binding domain